jgi:hypothetical protein
VLVCRSFIAMRTTLLAAVVIAALLVGSRRADAGGTTPLLALSDADAARADAGGTTVAVRGTFAFGDLVEGSLSGALVVWSGTRFVRFDPAGNAVAGDAAFLADGLVSSEVEPLLALGAPAAAPAALAQLRADRVAVVLPAGFPSGAASVAIVAVYEGGGVMSNPVAVTLP